MRSVVSLYVLGLMFVFQFIAGCEVESGSESERESGEGERGIERGVLSEEEVLEKAKRFIESFLKINATENYTLTYEKAHLDTDTLVDYVFLVNREEFALKKIEEEGKESFFEYLGRTGLYNYVFVYIAGEDKFLDTPPVGSAVEHTLTFSKGHLTAPSREDFWVDYRIRNSMHRNYYTVMNNKLYLTFNCPIFDDIGEEQPKAYAIEHKESEVRIAKDIYMYHAELENYDPSTIEDVNTYTPDRIIGTDDLFVFFLFDEKERVYKTPFKRDEVGEKD